MNRYLKTLLKKGDIIIIAGTLLIAVVLMVVPLLKDGSGTVAVVVVNGEIIEMIDLEQVNEPREINISGGKLLIEHGAVCYVEADCNDHCCIKMGRLSKPGDIAVCLPNKTCVYIEGKTVADNLEDDIDAVTY